MHNRKWLKCILKRFIVDERDRRLADLHNYGNIKPTSYQ
jgi:hypothetical protein